MVMSRTVLIDKSDLKKVLNYRNKVCIYTGTSLGTLLNLKFV